MSSTCVLVVEDEQGVRFALRHFLETSGYRVLEADTWMGAEQIFARERPDAAILDYLLPDGNALDGLARLKEISPDAPLIILTGHGSIELAVQAVKEGADHFLTKPVELPALSEILQRLLADRRARAREVVRKSRLGPGRPDPFVGTSAAIRRLAEDARMVAASESPILIQGATGAGKGVLARWLHDNGPRAEEAFVDVNCAALSREFLETELFGHRKGAFTGATAMKVGLLEVAHRGTVFLDEIGDVDPQVQPKLLKVLEEKRFRRLGDVRDQHVDVRLITATHQNLGDLVREQRFRSDLYYRISTVPLRIPALRERGEDVPMLAHRLLESLAAELGRGAVHLSTDAVHALQAYPWPGNIRELRNVLERALLLSEGRTLERSHLRFDAPPEAGPPSPPDDLTLAEVERQYIERVLRQKGGRVRLAAQMLGVSRSSLYDKIKRYGITVPRP